MKSALTLRSLEAQHSRRQSVRTLGRTAARPMRIGILTFHAGINHGAFLQAWSSCEFLRSAGFEVVVVDYQNRAQFWQEHRGLLVRYDPRNVLGNIRKIITFRRSHRLLPRTRPVRSVTQAASLELDAIVVGSDIVWNYELPWLGRDPIYFGIGLEKFRRVSYAASFGPLPPGSHLPVQLRTGLQGFHALSVRDEFSRAFLQREVGRTAELVVDPTLLIDLPQPQPLPSFVPAPYLLVYAYSLRDREVQEARAFARARGLWTVAIGYPQRWCDWCWLSADPFAWLTCFQHAEAVLTSTFHGSLFALKCGKPFVASSNNSIRDKTVGFLTLLGLDPRVSVGTASIDKWLGTPLDVSALDVILGPLIEKSQSYLLAALE
jgi:hypothetical protein